MAFQRDNELDRLIDPNLGNPQSQQQQTTGDYDPQNNCLACQTGYASPTGSGLGYGQLPAYAPPPMYAVRNPYLRTDFGMMNLLRNE
jgi:hypothetical protein